MSSSTSHVHLDEDDEMTIEIVVYETWASMTLSWARSDRTTYFFNSLEDIKKVLNPFNIEIDEEREEVLEEQNETSF